MKTKIIPALTLVLASPSVAQVTPADPGNMRCADFVKAAKSSSGGAFAGISTGSEEADAEVAKINQAVAKVCTQSPKITVREAFQQALIEFE
ncbi:hypothetical protein AA309_24580 [Microvirga vignae]|uniref:Uncharacterized protein n=1 Tax=Microvirga vignae TaxID=1225564 RepID=A0A0H1R6E7_9HYPH|nr:hypothetical protein [Microvirga vignae]KLK90619.1 hypothetical protein AA309_24580 [Microvirga vignae]